MLLINKDKLIDKESYFLCDCPLHEEDTPHLVINKSMQQFKCYQCKTIGKAVPTDEGYKLIEEKKK